MLQKRLTLYDKLKELNKINNINFVKNNEGMLSES